METRFKLGDRLTSQGAAVTVIGIHPIGCPKLKKELGKEFAETIYEVKSDHTDDKNGEGWLVPGSLLKYCAVSRPKRTAKEKVIAADEYFRNQDYSINGWANRATYLKYLEITKHPQKLKDAKILTSKLQADPEDLGVALRLQFGGPHSSENWMELARYFINRMAAKRVRIRA